MLARWVGAGGCIDACMSDMTEPRAAFAPQDVPHAESHFSSFEENAEMAKLPKFRFRRMAPPRSHARPPVLLPLFRRKYCRAQRLSL